MQANVDPLNPPFEIPTRRPQQWTSETLIPFVKSGIMVELSTIPLYLYAMYSIKPESGGLQAQAELRGVVQQEMLHVALTGNLLSSLGGSLDLYDYKVIPRYPSRMLVGKIKMNLTGATKTNLNSFLEIEAADNPRPSPDNAEPGLLQAPMLPSHEVNADLLPEYKSIGDFYADLEKGLRTLPDKDFSHNADKQFSGMDFFSDQMVVITDQASALAALNIVVEQGEGNIVVENSHYTVFTNLYQNQTNWSLYNVLTNPTTWDYTKKPGQHKGYISALSRAFDAGYCYMLQTIQRVWQTGRGNNEILLRVLLLRNTQVIMTKVLSPLANILVHQVWGWGDDNAAPCFNYYPMGDNGVTPKPPLDPKTLHAKLVEEVVAALKADNSDKEVLDPMKTFIEKDIPPFPN